MRRDFPRGVRDFNIKLEKFVKQLQYHQFYQNLLKIAVNLSSFAIHFDHVIDDFSRKNLRSLKFDTEHR